MGSRCTTRTSGLALAVGVLSLGVQLGDLAHLTLVPHVRCAAHGELAHTEAEAHAAHHGAAEGAETSDGDAGHGWGAAVADHPHDHCLVATLGRERAILASASLAPKPSGWPAVCNAQPAPDTWIVPGSMLLRSAPKHSPPVFLASV